MSSQCPIFMYLRSVSNLQRCFKLKPPYIVLAFYKATILCIKSQVKKQSEQLKKSAYFVTFLKQRITKTYFTWNNDFTHAIFLNKRICKCVQKHAFFWKCAQDTTTCIDSYWLLRVIWICFIKTTSSFRKFCKFLILLSRRVARIWKQGGLFWKSEKCAYDVDSNFHWPWISFRRFVRNLRRNVSETSEIQTFFPPKIRWSPKKKKKKKKRSSPKFRVIFRP